MPYAVLAPLRYARAGTRLPPPCSPCRLRATLIAADCLRRHRFTPLMTPPYADASLLMFAAPMRQMPARAAMISGALPPAIDALFYAPLRRMLSRYGAVLPVCLYSFAAYAC